MEIQDASGTGSRATVARLLPVAHRRVPEARQIPSERRGKGSRSIVLFLQRDPSGLLISCETNRGWLDGQDDTVLFNALEGDSLIVYIRLWQCMRLDHGQD